MKKFIVLVVSMMTLGATVAAQNSLEISTAGQLSWLHLLLCIGIVSMAILQKVVTDDSDVFTTDDVVRIVAGVIAGVAASITAFTVDNCIAVIIALGALVPVFVALALDKGKYKKLAGYIYYSCIIVLMILLYYQL